MFEKIESCLACGNDHLIPVLDLNDQPLANSYTKTKDEELPEFPLNINRCSKCFHVQLSVSVNPDLMFKEYLYVSGTSQTMRDYFDWFAKFANEYYRILSDEKVYSALDIGCNDGSQLDSFNKVDPLIETYGIDPAENLYEKSSRNHEVFCGYFDSHYAKTNTFKDIIVAQNVFAHNYNPLAFMRNVSELMHDFSLFFVQTSQANMILNNEFDTIYHEHISFYNIKSMDELCKRSGLNLIDVVKTPLHGTSYLFVISKGKSRSANIENLIRMEEIAGLYSDETYIKYEQKCKDLTNKLKDTIEEYRNNGFKIVGYGAAAKGNTLLNFSKIQMEYIIDDNPMKHNYYTPGSKIKIVSKDILDEYTSEDKILFVPLAWNFFKEISNNIKNKRTNPNDRFLTYFPQVQVF